MGSTRLPGKVLRVMCGRSMLSHNLDRLKRLNRADRLIVAIPDGPADEELARHCMAEGVDCFLGSEGDVLARYYYCARQFHLDHIVRATADCPLVDPVEADALVSLHLDKEADYSSSKNEVGCGLPNGMGLEVFAFPTLQRSHMEGHQPNHREHINEYVTENRELFRIAAHKEPPEKSAPGLDVTVDTLRDFVFVNGIMEHFHGDHQAMTTEAIIAYCGTFPVPQCTV